MKIITICFLVATLLLAFAQSAYIKIIRDDRVYPRNGVFSFEFETENGIIRSETGAEDLSRSGVISYPMPNGEIFSLKFVADAEGYKPESTFLPVPPVFPHPIPPHALRQIERGERERAERERQRQQ